MFHQTMKTIQSHISGAAALRDVQSIARYHRIQASPGYRAAAEYCAGVLRDAGLDVNVHSFPANTETRYWSCIMFQEWDCQAATLHAIAPAQAAGKLADYRDSKIAVIQRSFSTPPEGTEADVVVVEDGTEPAHYEGLDVVGKVVLTNADVHRVYELAVKQRGAVGIIFDGMRPAPPVRDRMTIPDALQYTSFWWASPNPQPAWGFVLSPRAGERLRNAVRQHGPVRVRAHVDARLYDGAIEVVDAFIPGATDEEVWLVAHLCHPEPSANDNASGSAALLETARVLHRLIAEGALPQPRRGLRFLLVPEMSGTYAYLATHEDRIPHVVAALNLDMVGEDQDQCQSVMLAEQPPHAAPNFSGDLLAAVIEATAGDSKTHAGMGSYALFRHAASPFSGGSDHYILGDPTVGIPCPMIIQWPDVFYHTSQDTPDKTDPASLARAATVAATYLAFLASAGAPEANWLGHEMLTRFKSRVARQAQDMVTAALQGEQQAPTPVAHVLDYHAGRMAEALGTLGRLTAETDFVASLVSQARHVAGAEAKSAQARVPESAPTTPRPLAEWDERAAQMVPHRVYPGPISTHGWFEQLAPKEREALAQLMKSRRMLAWTMPVISLYWADGQRTLADIADLVESETGQRDMELLVRYFQTLGQLGLVTF
ncbi:MAG: DUF4910 domain-containing protein [Chloroflexi bacterium]|nr:DUF4910 domain-containing protein [Chloroflexota bacterium]MBU1751727.1 DUF4910 domain-containing protein [Chloroflexota bacterium]MBU1877955.1 DUF4910 domain-containing protein [Chloroflexota bacterium]